MSEDSRREGCGGIRFLEIATAMSDRLETQNMQIGIERKIPTALDVQGPLLEQEGLPMGKARR